LLTVRDPWCTIDQGFEIAFSAGHRKVLEYIAARVHDGDNDSGQCLAEDRRCGHRHKRNGVDAQSTGE
jgi:hypothetical protein